MPPHPVSRDAMLASKELDDITDNRQLRLSLNGERSAETQGDARRMTHPRARAP